MSSSFTKPLVVSPLEDGKHWKLVEAFEYHIGSLLSKEIICVPMGFITDFASVPQIFWNILPPWGKYGKAAVVHDYLYHSKVYNYDRKQSDKIFYEAMKVLDIPFWKRYIMYLAVRIFAGFDYTKI